MNENLQPSAPKQEQPEATSSAQNHSSANEQPIVHKLDMRAESWINAVARIVLILTFVIAGFMFFAALFALMTGKGYFFESMVSIMVLIIAGVTYWALMKILTNISSNLHIIRNRIDHISNKMDK